MLGECRGNAEATRRALCAGVLGGLSVLPFRAPAPARADRSWAGGTTPPVPHSEAFNDGIRAVHDVLLADKLRHRARARARVPGKALPASCPRNPDRNLRQLLERP